jgi:hypothetical protein
MKHWTKAKLTAVIAASLWVALIGVPPNHPAHHRQGDTSPTQRKTPDRDRRRYRR